MIELIPQPKIEHQVLESQNIKSQDIPGYLRKELSRRLFLSSPYLMGKYLLGYDKFTDTQIQWSDWIVSHINPRQPKGFKALILMPRETYKTSFFTVTVPLWIAANDVWYNQGKISQLVGNEVVTNACDFLKEIKGHIEKEEFIYFFGDWRTKNDWRSSDVTFARRTQKRKEPSIGTCGIGSTTTSKHYGFVFLDDIAGTDDRDSQAKRDATFNFFNDIWDILNKEDGIILVIGTRWHTRDIYYHIKEMLNPELKRNQVQPFEILEMPAHDKKGNLNFPNILSEKKLKELRIVKLGQDAIDEATFYAQYELRPLDPKTQVFKIFHYYNHTTTSYKFFLQWTDPALSDKSTACYAAILVIGKIDGGPHDNKWGVCYASIERREPSKIIKDHNRIYIMHRNQYKKDIDIFMESNGFQMLLKNESVQAALKEDQEIPTVGRPNKDNKIARIRAMEPFVSTGLILFRDDWRDAPEGYKLLMEQLKNFPQGAIDAPDALQGSFKQSQSRHYG